MGMHEADSTLLERWRYQRDSDAFNALVDRYGSLVYGACLRVLRNPEAASDATQESFAALARVATPDIRNLAAWLHGVATKHSLLSIRTEARRRSRELQYAQTADHTETPSWDDISPLIDEAIAELPDRYKTVILAHFFERRSHQQISVAEDIARRTVSYRIQRGLKLIRKRLIRNGIYASVAHLGILLTSQPTFALPAMTSHWIGTLLVSLSTAPMASSPSLFATLTGGVNSMLMKIGIAAVIVATPLVLWKNQQPATEADPPAVQAPSPQQSAAVPARTAPQDPQPASPPPLQLAANQQEQTNNNPPTETTEAGATISGRIYRSGSGEPLVGQLVSLVDLSLLRDTFEAATVAEVETEPGTGAYSFPSYPPGSYAIMIELPQGLYSAARPTSGQFFEQFQVKTSAEQHVFDIEVFEGTATLTGTLLIGGQPAPDTTFILRPFSTQCTDDAPCVTDAAGRFSLDGLAPFEGDLSASISHEGGTRRGSLLVPVYLEANVTTDVTFDFAWGNTSIEGAVYRRVDGVLKSVQAGWNVIYRQVDSHPESGRPTGNIEGISGKTDTDGTFLIENLQPGRVSVDIFPDDGDTVRHRVSFDIASGVRYIKDFVLGDSIINVTALSIPASTESLYYSIFPGDVDPLPSSTTTRDNFVQRFLHFDSLVIATTSDRTFKGLSPGTYTVIAASWPCEASAEAARAMGLEFIYTFGVARKVVNVSGYKQTVDVVLDDFHFVPRPVEAVTP